MIRTPKPICRHPLEDKVTITLRGQKFMGKFFLFLLAPRTHKSMKQKLLEMVQVTVPTFLLYKIRTLIIMNVS